APRAGGAGRGVGRGGEVAVAAPEGAPGGAVQITMPQMGESVTEGTMLEWHKQEGDQVNEGDVVVEVSTDKVDAEVPAPASGTITRLLAQADETVSVGQVLAEMSAGAVAAAESEQPRAEAPPAPPGAAAEGDGHRASPVA